MKKIVILLTVMAVTVFAQTSRFQKFLQNTSGQPVTGAVVYIINEDNPADSLLLTEHTQKPGVYYRDNVPYGQYRIRVNGVLVQEHYYFGAKREKLFIEALDPDGDNKLNENSLIDSTISLKKLTPAAVNFIGSGGNIVNNPDDVTLENKSGNVIGIKDSYLNDFVGPTIIDSLNNFQYPKVYLLQSRLDTISNIDGKLVSYLVNFSNYLSEGSYVYFYIMVDSDTILTRTIAYTTLNLSGTLDYSLNTSNKIYIKFNAVDINKGNLTNVKAYLTIKEGIQ